eukprot:591476-Pyramimonas_sp.AAC.1
MNGPHLQGGQPNPLRTDGHFEILFCGSSGHHRVHLKAQHLFLRGQRWRFTERCDFRKLVYSRLIGQLEQCEAR